MCHLLVWPQAAETSWAWCTATPCASLTGGGHSRIRCLVGRKGEQLADTQHILFLQFLPRQRNFSPGVGRRQTSFWEPLAGAQRSHCYFPLLPLPPAHVHARGGKGGRGSTDTSWDTPKGASAQLQGRGAPMWAMPVATQPQ